MESRSLTREIALLILGQISDHKDKNISFENILSVGIETLVNYCREQLDYCAAEIELAQQDIDNFEINLLNKEFTKRANDYLITGLNKSENILNVLSDTLELIRVLTLSDQQTIREEAKTRVKLVIKNFEEINTSLDNVMEGWRLKRLPRIDQDILRLAYVDLYHLRTPIAVSCNEAVNLAKRYSDDQGRKMINGVLRRLQDHSSQQSF